MDNLKDLEKAISELQKLKDDGVIPLFADGILKAYNDLLPLVKKCDLADVVERSEQLKAVEKLKDFAYEVCPLHREDDLEEIVGRL